MKERRKIKRHYLIYYMRVFDIDTHHLVGYLVDITPRGVMLLCDDPPSLNKIFNLKLELSEDISEKPYLHFQAKSIWCQADIDPHFYNAGYHILQITPEDQEIIEKIVKKYGLQQQRKLVREIPIPEE